KSAQIREILISESAWEEMTCLFAPSLTLLKFLNKFFVLRPYLSLLLYQKYCTVVHTIYLNYLKSRQTVILIG
ncbi:hypothetical protein BL167_00024615, partial [Klebsiella pneumoniae]